MAEMGRLVDDPEPFDRIALPMERNQGLGDELEMRGRVNAPRDGQADHFQSGISFPSGPGIALPEHHPSNFDGPDPRLPIQGDGQGPAWIPVAGQVRQEPVREEIDGVTADGLEDRDAGLVEEPAQVRDVGRPVFEVIVIQDFLQPAGDGFEVAAGQTAVGREPLADDEQVLEAGG